MTLFLFTTGIVIAIIIKMNLIWTKQKQEPKSLVDDLSDDPESKIKDYWDMISKLKANGTTEDMIPDGYGEFGHAVTNPIPVKNIRQNRTYLESLRTLDGKEIEYDRIGSTFAPNIALPIDAYEIFVDGKITTTLYISPYHKKISRKAPNGFKLVELP